MFTEIISVGTPQQTYKFARDVTVKLCSVPEVSKTCEWMTGHTSELSTIIKEYVSLITKLDGYGKEQLIWIEKATFLMMTQEQITNASSLKANDFLLTRANPNQSFRATAVQAFNSRNVSYEPALSQLAEMMWLGHEMFAESETPRDGDPRSDRVIWGHTQVRADASPDILAHFIIAHYLGRFFSKTFAIEGEHRLAENKDAFLALATAAFLLEEVQNPGSTGSIRNVWLTSKNDGGLGWISQGQLNAYLSCKI